MSMTQFRRGGLIGCGHISHQQLRAWQAIQGAEIVAVCDLDQEKAQERAREFGIAHVYDDYRRMLDELPLDFVDIATRPATHLELVTAAARRGLPILCQKPLAGSMAEARQMVALCRETNVPFMVNENTRHQAWFRQAKSLLDAGALGEPFYARFEARSRSSLPSPDFGDQPYFQEMPLLIVYEMDIHYLDTARYLFGEATALMAHLRQVSPHIAGEDFAVLLATFGDVTCLVDSSWCSVPEPGEWVPWGPFRLEGTEGTLVLGQDGTLTLYTDQRRQSWQFPKDTLFRSFIATQQHFVDCLDRGREAETSGTETLKTLALVFAAYRSAAAGRVVQVAEML